MGGNGYTKVIPSHISTLDHSTKDAAIADKTRVHLVAERHIITHEQNLLLCSVCATRIPLQPGN